MAQPILEKLFLDQAVIYWFGRNFGQHSRFHQISRLMDFLDRNMKHQSILQDKMVRTSEIFRLVFYCVFLKYLLSQQSKHLCRDKDFPSCNYRKKKNKDKSQYFPHRLREYQITFQIYSNLVLV